MKKIYMLFLSFTSAIAGVVIFSLLSTGIWQEKPEEIPAKTEIIISMEDTVTDFGTKNGLPNPLLKDIFRIASKDDLNRTISSFNIPPEEIKSRTEKVMVLKAETESKNWFKIPLKFTLWFAALAVAFLLIIRKKINRKVRLLLYISSVTVFGVILGSDPSPMGTVKDALVLYGINRVIFPPRMIAFIVFMILVIVANKFICSWGCQFGTLQDFIFRLNRNSRDTGALTRQYKVPFIISNTVRILFLVFFTAAAFIWSIDLFHNIDPFKIFKPAVLNTMGIAFIALLLILSLFVYRPWCHFFCPFGLAGWLGEKISIFKIKVNYDSCIACSACSKACPSTVMGAILKRDKIIPDCYSCGTCIDACPTDSISFAVGKRPMPPEGKFEKNKKV